MISIIICSRKKELDANLSENIKNTVGCEYELVVIDNSKSTYSIYEAYNLGIEKSIGEYLCFLHDDVFIHTYGWGYIIARVFIEDQQIGLIGIAGAKVKTKAPSAWWDCSEDQKVINIIQHFPNKDKEKYCLGFNNTSIQEVVVIDGVFMSARKVKGIRFSNFLNGFHNYDLNFSFEYLKHDYKIVVSRNILIEHFSLGTLNESWVDSTHKIHYGYNDLLPLGKKGRDKENEIYNTQIFINKCVKYGKNKVALFYWIKLFCIYPIKKYHFRFWKNLIKKNLC